MAPRERSRRKSASPSVVLPDPLSPTTPTVRPSRTAQEMPSTALIWPTVRRSAPRLTGNQTRTSSARMTSAAPSGAGGGSPLGSAASRRCV